MKPYHRHSLHDGFNGFLRALPGVRDFSVTVIGAMQSIVANLTPAKGRLVPAFRSSCAIVGPLSRTSESKGHKQIYDSSAAFDLKFLLGLAAISSGTSNRRHWYHTPSPSACNIARPSMRRVHRIPRSTSVTIAKRPSYRARDGRACRDDLPDGHSGIFLRKGLDRPNQIELL